MNITPYGITMGAIAGGMAAAIGYGFYHAAHGSSVDSLTNRFMERYDHNADGSISLLPPTRSMFTDERAYFDGGTVGTDEYVKTIQPLLERADTNKDTSVSQAELGAAIGKLDTNGDGRINGLFSHEAPALDNLEPWMTYKTLDFTTPNANLGVTDY